MTFREAAGDRPQTNAAVALRDAWQATSGTEISVETFERRAIALPLRPNSKATRGAWSTPWIETAAAYASLSGIPNAQISTLRVSHGDAEALTRALINATEDMATGDVVALDIAGKTGRQRGVTRDELGRALFKAGLEN